MTGGRSHTDDDDDDGDDYCWPEAGAIRLTIIDDGSDDCRWLFLFRFLFYVIPSLKGDVTPAGRPNSMVPEASA